MSAALATEVIGQLLEHHGLSLEDHRWLVEALDTRLQTHDFDLREVLFDLYDDYRNSLK